MPIKLPKEAAKRCVESIQAFFDEHMDASIGDLKARLVLDFCLQEICPTVYNRAIADAQAYMADKSADMDGSLFEEEFGYFSK
ncbi:MAG: DUF2164 domain-containing protein [Acidobacteriota bacterium]